MSYSRCSGNFSSRSPGGALRCPGSACGSSCPSNLVYSPGLGAPGTCPLGSSLHRGRQETCWEPASCPPSRVVSGPCPPSCCRPRTSTLCRPCRSADTMSLGCGSSRGRSLGYGGFRPLGYGVCGFPSLRSGSAFCRPTYLASRSCPSSCYRPCQTSLYRPRTVAGASRSCQSSCY